MAYVPPTIDDFLERFPEFDDNLHDDQIEALLVEAQTQIDESWREADYQIAIMLWVAHNLVRDGADGEGSSQGAIASESFGPISVSYAQSSKGSSTSTYATTDYGQRFLKLLKGNFPPIVVL